MMTTNNNINEPLATFAYIYSDGCAEQLVALVDTFQIALHGENAPRISLADMFYYGVFCKTGTYSTFDWSVYSYQTFDVPDILTNGFATDDEKTEYIRQVINMVMAGKKTKPEWMQFIEENATCDDYDSAPSTFLRLLPKDEKYQDLANAILKFLYSPNRQTSIFEE